MTTISRGTKVTSRTNLRVGPEQMSHVAPAGSVLTVTNLARSTPGGPLDMAHVTHRGSGGYAWLAGLTPVA